MSRALAGMMTSAMIVPAKATALTTNPQPGPATATSRPPSPGPMSRPALNDIWLSAMALPMLLIGTSSETNVCRTGWSNADVIPSAADSPNTIQSSIVPVRVSTARAIASSAWMLCVTSSVFFRSNRSATSAVSGSSATGGRKFSTMLTATAVASSFVRTVSTSQSWAIRCTHVPRFDAVIPIHQMR